MTPSLAPPSVEHGAPVQGQGSIDVHADPATVWSVMSEIDNWPAWSADISSARLLGPLAPGTEFEWRAGPGTIRSRLIAVAPNQHLAWTGSTMGIRAVHVWRIEPSARATTVVTEESWSGLLASLLRGSMRKRLQHAIHEGLGHLKREAERRQAGEHG